MSTFGHLLERVAEAAEKNLAPFVKKAEKIAVGILEGIAIDRIVTKIDSSNTASEKNAPPATVKNVPAAATKAAPAAAVHCETAPHSERHSAAPVTPTAGATAPVFSDRHQFHDGRQSVGFGSTGAAVREVQRDLGVTVDGIDGPQTTAALRAFQGAHGLRPDGVAGPKTWPVLSAEPSLHEGSQGAAVRRVQSQLGVHVDGIDGPQTTAAVKSFQKAHGLTVDGIVGIHTWKALDTAAELAKAFGPPADVPKAHAPAMSPTPAPAAAPLGPSPNTNQPTFSLAEQKAGEAFKAVYDAAVGDDLKTLGNQKASASQRVIAGIDLATNVIDLPKGAGEVALKLGIKATARGVEEAALVAAGSAALQAATRLGEPVATGASMGTPVPSAQTTTAHVGSLMYVRYAGEDREMANGYRQSGKIVSVQDGIVTQSTGRSTAEYKLSELIAQSRDPVAIEKLLVPGNNVVISVESQVLQVTSLEQHHERTQVQSR